MKPRDHKLFPENLKPGHHKGNNILMIWGMLIYRDLDLIPKIMFAVVVLKRLINIDGAHLRSLVFYL